MSKLTPEEKLPEPPLELDKDHKVAFEQYQSRLYLIQGDFQLVRDLVERQAARITMLEAENAEARELLEEIIDIPNPSFDLSDYEQEFHKRIRTFLKGESK